MKAIKLLVGLFLVFPVLAFAETGVSDVKVAQRWPWNGLVDIEVSVRQDEGRDVRLFVSCGSHLVKNIWLASDASRKAPLVVKPGSCHLVWDAGKDAPDVIDSAAQVTVRAVEDDTEYYMKVDLSAGPLASSYPISYHPNPRGNPLPWNDPSKSMTLWMRLIEPGVYRIGCDKSEVGYRGDEKPLREVQITTPFFMAVFETTQRQWELVTGRNPSTFANPSHYQTRPVESVTYNEIRGSSSGGLWPQSAAVDASSFVGKLRARTGLSGFDLPTDAQWEYACRAGTTTALNNGTNLKSTTKDTNLNKLARYLNDVSYKTVKGKIQLDPNATTASCTAKVGSYAPNAWGLYDMHGNVREWCLDWYWGNYDQLSNDTAVDPVGPQYGISTASAARTLRGGGFLEDAKDCRSASRMGGIPNQASYANGFRLACTMANALPWATSAYFKLDTRPDAFPATGDVVLPFDAHWGNAESVVVKAGDTVLAEAASGVAMWKTGEFRPGRYELSHASGTETLTAAAFVVDNNVVVHSTDVTGEETWTADRLHIVERPLNVTGSLKLEPGTVVKFVRGASLMVWDGAWLWAPGTRTSPVVLTSIFDDAAGGDTNKDGDLTVPNAGDWHFIAAEGSAQISLDHCEVRYGGGPCYGTTGMLVTFGEAKLTVLNSRLCHSPYDCVFSSGETELDNTLIYDCDRGLNSHSGESYLINCTVDGCGWGVMAEGGDAYCCNCIITGFTRRPDGWPAGYGVSLWSDNILAAFNCDIWSDLPESELYFAYSGFENGLYLADSFTDDPKFFDPETGDYRIAADSPCVDAGNSQYSTAKDAFGRPHMNVPDAKKTGTPDANGIYPDIGIYEVLGDGPKADLEAVSLTAPAAMMSGQKATLTWTVRNVGEIPASDGWMDGFELVAANGQVVRMGGYEVPCVEIGVGETKTFTADINVPCAFEGECRVRVILNRDGYLLESAVDNNRCDAEATSTLTLMTLELPADGSSYTFDLDVESQMGFRFPYESDEDAALIVRADGDLFSWASMGLMSTRDNASSVAVEVGPGVWLLRIPTDGSGRIAFANDGVAGLTAGISLLTGDFVLLDGYTKTLAGGGRISLPFFGNGFTEDMDCWLEGGGSRVDASDLMVANPMQASAVFDVRTLPLGPYELHIARDGTELSAAILELVEPTGGESWQCELGVAETVRKGRTYLGVLRYSNVGDQEMAAPYVSIKAEPGTLIRLTEADAWTDSIDLMATSDTYPASALKPGDECHVTFYYMTNGDSVNLTYSYTLSGFDRHHLLEPPRTYSQRPGREEEFPWSKAATDLRPSWATDQLWNIALATLKDRFGMRWDDYLDRMRADCDHLHRIGTPTRRVDRLMQLELNEALGTDHAVGSLASAIDLSRPGRGFGLSFSRTYGASLSARHRKSVFGYGWADNYSTRAELQDAKTLVFHLPSGGSYLFTKASGEWKPSDARDKTTLVETDSSYVLKYASGTVQSFAKLSGRCESIADNQGNRLTFTWSGASLVKATHSDGQFLSFAYAGDKVTSVTDDLGHTTTYAYSVDQLISVTSWNGLVTRYDYFPSLSLSGVTKRNALQRITYPDGSYKEFDYDEQGLVRTSTVNGSLTTTVERGELGSYEIVAPNGGRTTVIVGASGETLKTVNALGQVVEQVYTADSLLESTIAPSGRRNKITYDKNGTPISSMSASGATTSFSYTSTFDNLASVTDARGNAFSYEYDDLGRGTSVGYADGTASRSAYDAAKGDLVKSTNRRGQQIAYQYDERGELVKTTWPDGRTFTLTRDAKGNVIEATDSLTGTVTMEYDANERLTKITYPKGRGFTYTYDAAGRILSRTTLDGALAQKYVYDAFGRLARLTDGNGNLYLENAYDAATGELVRQTYGNGTSTEYAYDLLGRTTSITHKKGGTVLESFAYEYDEDGRRISQTTKEGKESYVYDNDGQLTGVTYPDGSAESFTYDAVGNRTKANGVAYTANALNQYTAIGSGTCAYDADGNLTRTVDAKGTTDYFYDVQNRLVGVSNVTANIRWSCVYDVFGNRVRIDDNGKVTEKLYVLGDLSSVAAEYDSSGALTKRHILSGSVRIADLNGEAVSSPLQSDSIRYYHTDGLASTRLLTDGTGAVKGTASYKAFGETRKSSGESTDAGYVGTLGVETDPNGLLFMRNRYYSATQGRFVQMDPIKFCTGEENFYLYCRNFPVDGIDVSGLWVDVYGDWEKLNENRGSICNVQPPANVDEMMGQINNGNINNYRELPWWQSVLHKLGNWRNWFNRKFVNDAGCEHVYDINGNLLPTGINQGTANYCTEKDGLCHLNNDMDPWFFIDVPKHLGIENITKPIIKPLVNTGGILGELVADGVHYISSFTVASEDPNEIRGTAGVGSKRYVAAGTWLDYTIYFENKNTATAAANDVYVNLPMAEGCDWSTLELGEIAFGDHFDTGLVGKRNGTSLYAYPGSNTFVKTEVKIEDGMLKWRIRDWVKETVDNYPEDARVGFLPPNNPDTHCGEGHVTYRVKVRDDAPAGTYIKASAKIIFDTNAMIETDPFWFNTVGSPDGRASFGETETSVNEGETLKVTVCGGNGELASSVQVQAVYNTAAAADLDLKNATVNGEKPKSFKFPVTFSWPAGEVGDQTIEIPVAADKSVEADEFLTLQLLNPKNMQLDGGTTFTVTIRDPKYAELQKKVADGTATDVEVKELAKADKTFAGKSYVRALANDATRGKVTGSALAADGKNAKLKATANKGFVFAGWYTDEACAPGSELQGYGDYRNPSLAYVQTNGAITVFARFIMPEEDGLELDADFLPAEFAVGEAVSILVPVESVSYPTVKVAGLPSGLKYYAKETFVKATKTADAYTIPANTIFGTPTKATTKPAAVTVTVKNLGGYQIVRKYEVSVVATAPSPAKAKVVSDAQHYYSVSIDLNDDFAGKVTGAGVYQAGKKVTLKATPNKGYAFNGWYAGADLLSQAASYVIARMPTNDLAYVAKFVTTDEDKASIAAGVNGTALSSTSGQETASPLATNVMAGVYLEWPVSCEALSLPTVAVSGLPSGLKFTAKPVTKTTGSGKSRTVVTNVPANTIYGAPTAASKTDKHGNVTPSKVKVTVTTAGKSKAVYEIALTVDPLPVWAVGTFSGLSRTGDRLGSASMTVAASGKVSGKMLVGGTNVSFTASCFDASSKTVGGTSLVAKVEGKLGKAAVAGEVTVIAEGATGFLADASVELERNVWKDKGAAKVPDAVQGLYTVRLAADGDRGTGHLSLKVGKDGAVKVTGKTPEGTSLSGTVTLMPDGEGYFADLFCAPSDYKGGYVAGRLAWDAGGAVTGASPLDWISLNPQATDDYYGGGFRRTLKPRGAWYSTATLLSDYYRTLDFNAPNGEAAVEQAHWGDLTVSVDASGKKFVVDQKVTKPVQDKTSKAWSYEGANDAALAISFTQATGIWKGSFLWWFDEPKHTSTKVPFEGILVPGEDLEGAGTYTVPASYTPLDRYGNPQKTQKTYKVKESVPVRFVNE